MRLFLLSLAFLMLSTADYAQTNLLPNFGFEYNTLLNWRCYRNSSGTTIPSSITNNTTPLSGTNTTVAALYTGTTYYVAGTAAKVGYVRTTSSTQKNDYYGNYPVVCPFPGSGKHSVKLGNDSLMSVCQGTQYNIHIPASAQKYKIVFYYAIDLEDPGAHECWEMPFFNVVAFDSANKNVVIPCSQLAVDICSVKNDPNLWGNWHTSTKLSYTNSDSVYYVGWTPSTIIAKNMGGRTLTLRFTSSGCSPSFGVGTGSPGSHFGYAYVDLDTTVGAYNVDTLKYCKHDSCLSYTPPPGYKGYRIIDSATGTQLAIDTNHCVSCIPTLKMCGVNLPQPKTSMQVILTPYSGFGCVDTLTYYIDTFPTNILPKIISPADSICSKFSMTLTNATGGGLWVSSDTSTGTINNTGLFSGIKNGADSITYFANNKYGCPDTTYKSLFVVGHSILPIYGKNGVCIGDTLHLNDSTANGVWSVDNTSIATITQSGVLTGLSYGVSNVKYTYTNFFGCKDSAMKAIQVGIPPLQPIQGSNVLCVKHTDSLSNSTINGTWFSTNNSVATISSTGVVTGLAAGTTVIKYTVSFNGCSDSIKLPITVNAPIITQITGTTTVCQKHTIQLSNASAGGTWEPLNPTVATIDNNGVVTPGQPGTDTIRYILPISNGCLDSVYTVITVNHTPVVGAINGPSNVCFGVPVTFTDTTAGGTWVSVDTSIIKLNTTGTVQYVKAGTTSIKYIVKNSFGCSDSVSTTFTVNPIPVVGLITGQSSVCTGKSATLSISTVGGVWSSSDNSVASILGTTVTGIKGGSTVIKYTVISGNGCSDSSTFNFNVVDYPVVNAIVGDSILCLGHPATFTDVSSNGVWSVVDPTVATVSSTGLVTPVKLGNTSLYYKVTLPPGCSDSSKFDFRVNNFTMSLVSSSANPILETTPFTVNITNVSTPNYSVLNWLPSGLFISNTATSQSLVADTSVTICAIGKSDAGSCIDTACINIVVTPLTTTIFIPNVVKINANSPDNAIAKVHSTPKLKALDFRIYNQWGEMIYYTTDVNAGWDGRVNGTMQPVGVYVYVARCTTHDDKIVNKKGSITLVK